MGEIVSVLVRFDDWQRRLADALRADWETPFAWGGFDCCLAPSGLVLAMTGVDVAAPLRGYATRRGALMKLRRFVGDEGVARFRLGSESRMGDFVEAAAILIGESCGAPEIPVSRAQRGDVVVAEVAAVGPGGVDAVLAAVDLSGRFAVTAAENGGWARIPRDNFRRAWRV